MALQDLLELSATRGKKIGLSEERITPLIPVLRQYISFWREYPDIFIDTVLVGKENRENFKLFFYQRVK